MEPEDSGSGRSRVEDFLLGTLKVCTQQRYAAALEVLATRLEELEGAAVDDVDEAWLDHWIADWMVENAELLLAAGGLPLDADAGAQPLPRSFFGSVLSAISKTRPRMVLKTSWRVYDAWSVRQPPRQAPAAPPELIVAVGVFLVVLGQAAMGTLTIVCFAGLLRVGEGLGLLRRDVVIGDGLCVFLLGRTKRGLEQKVTVSSPSVVAWVRAYIDRHPMGPYDKFLPVSYATYLRWLRAAASALGAGSLGISTHSLRRSGATELSRMGVPLPDLLLYGRWLSERSAREYIRRGEVAVLRIRNGEDGEILTRCRRWCTRWPSAFKLAELLRECGVKVRPGTLSPEFVAKLEVLVLSQ